MTLTIDPGDYHSVDRSGSCRNIPGIEGFNIYFDGLTIAFEDERDAVKMAKDILWRMGETFDGKDKPT